MADHLVAVLQNEYLCLQQAGSDVEAQTTRTVELTETITAHAGHLASRHALRGADAVHLASLLAVGVAETLFAVWDQKLRIGAEAAGVRLAPMG